MAPPDHPPQMTLHSPTYPISFKRLMALETLDPDTYRSIAPAWAPGDGNQAFGGHIYAQAAYAAGKTVPKGMMLHNITGHFILPGRIDIPFIYHISRTHTGGSYAWRQVSAYQNSNKTPSFIATISFKRAEKHDARNVPIGHQSEPTTYLRKHYKSVLDGKEPETHPYAPSADTLVWMAKPRREGSTTGVWLPGVDIRKVDMQNYNGVIGEGGDGKVGRWRQLAFYRIITDDENESYENEEDELRLHISAHLFASDCNSLFMIQHAYGYQGRETRLGSLGHTVIFHGGVERLRMVDPQTGRRRWFVQEAWTSNGGENRGCHESWLWDWEKGEVVATTVQDGMVRVSAHKPGIGANEDGDGEGMGADQSRRRGRGRGRRRAQRVEMEGEEEEGFMKGKL